MLQFNDIINKLGLGLKTDSSGAPAVNIKATDNIPGAVHNDDQSVVASSTTATVAAAIPTNSSGQSAVGVEVGNQSATATDMVKILFGDSSVEATATEGHLIHAASVRVIPIHKDHAYYSIIALANTPDVNLVWHMPE